MPVINLSLISFLLNLLAFAFLASLREKKSLCPLCLGGKCCNFLRLTAGASFTVEILLYCGIHATKKYNVRSGDMSLYRIFFLKKIFPAK